MADLLSTGISGLLTSRIALDVTGHNISNVNTDGFSRQRATFDARTPLQTGPFFVGQGVQTSSIERIFSQFLIEGVRSATSGESRLGAFDEIASRLDNLLADRAIGLQPALSGFFASVQDLANNPSDTAARTALLGQANALTDRFNGIAREMERIDADLNRRISDSVSQINELGRSIASLNAEIQVSAASSPSNRPAADLLDKRDGLLKQLAGVVGLNAVVQDDSSINVFVGSGQALVLGNRSNQLAAVANPFDPTRTEVAVASTGVVVSAQINGGELGGLLDVRRDLLDPARAQLGRTAAGLALAFNDQHRAGMDLNGALGGDFFTVPGPTVSGLASNSAGLTLNASIADINAVTPFSYVLGFDGAAYALTRSDGAAIAMTGTGTALDPFVADGLNLVVAGAAAAGDRFQIRPVLAASSGIDVAITQTNRIAAAVPMRSLRDGANVGSGIISVPRVVDAANPALLTPLTISFTAANTYQINGAGAFAYSPGSTISVNGLEFEISEVPATGDVFTVVPNTGGVGDNGNALRLGEIINKGVLDGGATSIGSGFGQLVAQVGSSTAQARIGLDAQRALRNQAEQAQQSVSGVNLDEEAANLLRFEQSFQASARVIAVADTLFQTLLGAVQGR
ncbi:MAG: flagellar hook-associated protein FlgK [Xanthomonadaceae bacterium]|nr:flagellar hook-associated protein FlgK [Xanthomonadaceae bacterium]MDP2184552.1 flagellar hook-associated protein FlgK [Xanthomonadales bacterium]MDZ4116365.1 flagellar hook-associated protein FlgK [Xanthomonadaceae bacterium]MDZ4378896.1 flagellar hook-associated protein FlgK [Xanthomonadaceae bacterium]